jgi:hypothetical protein
MMDEQKIQLNKEIMKFNKETTHTLAWRSIIKFPIAEVFKVNSTKKFRVHLDCAHTPFVGTKINWRAGVQCWLDNDCH